MNHVSQITITRIQVASLSQTAKHRKRGASVTVDQLQHKGTNGIGSSNNAQTSPKRRHSDRSWTLVTGKGPGKNNRGAEGIDTTTNVETDILKNSKERRREKRASLKKTTLNQSDRGSEVSTKRCSSFIWDIDFMFGLIVSVSSKIV